MHSFHYLHYAISLAKVPAVEMTSDKPFFTRLNVKGKGKAPNVTYVIFNDSVDQPPSSGNNHHHHHNNNGHSGKKKRKRRTRSV